MKQDKAISLFVCIFFSLISLHAQQKETFSKEDLSALEGIIVEKYYVSTEEDQKDTTGGKLPIGSVTYRIYVDMKPGYHLQAVYGVPGHELFLKSTTNFFNNKWAGGQSGDQIPDSRINENTVALDSWVTIGVATKTRKGVLKVEDKDTSIIKRNGLDKADGLVLATGNIQKLLYYGLDLNFFNEAKNSGYFTSENGSWAVVGGGKGPTNENKVLIAQLTTQGKLSFELNLQIGTPGGKALQYVAKNPKGSEIKFKQLTRK